MAAAIAALVVVAVFVALPRLQPSTGTLLVVVSGRAEDSLASTSLQLHGSAGWTALGQVSGSVPAAPVQRQLLGLAVVAGTYDGVRLGDDEASVPIVVCRFISWASVAHGMRNEIVASKQRSGE